jgi:tetratricopeptide (TPR) repeat protein
MELRVATDLGVLQRYDEALEHMAKARELVSYAIGEKNALMIDILNNTSNMLTARGMQAEARAQSEAAVALCIELMGHDTPKTARLLGNLGFTLWRDGAQELGLAKLDEAIAVLEKVNRGTHADSIPIQANRIMVQLGLNRVAEAKASAQQFLDRLEKAAPNERRNARVHFALGAALVESGDAKAALPHLEKAYEARAEAEDAGDTDSRMLYLGRALCQAGTDCGRGQALMNEAMDKLKHDFATTPQELQPGVKWVSRFLHDEAVKKSKDLSRAHPGSPAEGRRPSGAGAR